MFFSWHSEESTTGKLLSPPHWSHIVLKRRLYTSSVYEYIMIKTKDLINLTLWTILVTTATVLLAISVVKTNEPEIWTFWIIGFLILALGPITATLIVYFREWSRFKETIEVYWDPDGSYMGKFGCFRARMQSNHGIHDVGADSDFAVEHFLLTAKSFGYSGKIRRYNVVKKL